MNSSHWVRVTPSLSRPITRWDALAVDHDADGVSEIAVPEPFDRDTVLGDFLAAKICHRP